MTELRQTLDTPSTVTPIVIFGSGSIVSDAHLPAYKQAGFPVAGIYDPDVEKASTLAGSWSTRAFTSVADAVADAEVIFDLAVPPVAIPDILRALPEGATVLIQKPMGSDLASASEILDICNAKNLKAAVNFQLRFAPMSLGLKDAIKRGLLGDIVDFDAWLALDTPWHLWQFLLELPRVEILLHSIHYLDFVRDILGDPQGVHAKTLGHPSSTVSNTRTAMILDYGQKARCALSINHNHAFGRKFQACEFRICGTKGAAYLKLGVNLDYPNGEPDELWLNTGEGWEQVPLVGDWFIEAFVGRMTQVQRFAAKDDTALQGSVQDAWNTMALVEAAYESSAAPAHPIQRRDDA